MTVIGEQVFFVFLLQKYCGKKISNLNIVCRRRLALHTRRLAAQTVNGAPTGETEHTTSHMHIHIHIHIYTHTYLPGEYQGSNGYVGRFFQSKGHGYGRHGDIAARRSQSSPPQSVTCPPERDILVLLCFSRVFC